MKTPLIALLCAVVLAGCTSSRFSGRDGHPPPLGTLSMSPLPALKESLDAVISDSLFPPSNVGIKVVSLSRNEVLYSLNEGMLFNPASNQKLFTSAVALRQLGPGFPLSTTVLLDTASRTLSLRGQGDPLMSAADFDSLARLAAPALSPSQPYSLLIDTSYFDDLYWGEGWTWDDEPAAYSMFLTPLIIHNNTVTVRVRPAGTPGMAPTVELEPPSPLLTVENTAITVGDTAQKRLRVSRRWRERTNVITVEGDIRAKGREYSEQLSVWRPDLYAGSVFAGQLGSRRIAISTIRRDTSLNGGREIARYERRLDSAVTFLNKVSDNLSAEVVLKILGAERVARPGSAQRGVSAIHSLLDSLGVDTLGISIADGSGLSRFNLTSAATIIALLKWIHSDTSAFAPFLASLPVAGVDGTIGSRMRETPAAGNLRAKTGTLSGVSALSGYVTTADRELVAFSILMQNFPGGARKYRNAQDQIGIILSRFRR